MPIPPIEEQWKLTRHLDEETKRIDQLVDTTRQSLRLLQERRTALITAAITGKIDVRGHRANNNNRLEEVIKE